MSELGRLRRAAMDWARDGLTETAIRDRLVWEFENDDQSGREAWAELASKIAADVKAAVVQPSGAVSRAPAVADLLQERLPWADLPAQVGYDELHRYLRRTDGIGRRRERYQRILAVLDPAWEARGLASCANLRAACEVAGVEATDIEALAA